MKTKIVSALLVVAALVACGCNSTTSTTDGGTNTNAFPQPGGTVPVNFIVDDSANKIHAPGALQWKGAFYWTTATRIITPDSSWSGGNGTTTEFPPLYDDGPWTDGGHEPAYESDGVTVSVAGDHILGVTVFVYPPDSGTETFGYGLQDTTGCDGGSLTSCNGWAWIPDNNGQYSVAAGATAAVTATGQTYPAFSTSDLQLTLDTTHLDTAVKLTDGGTFLWDAGTVEVKGTMTEWSALQLFDDGTHGDAVAHDGIYTFDAKYWLGAGTVFPNSGLSSGSTPRFAWNLSGVDYKNSGICIGWDGGVNGVAAGTEAPGASTFTATPVELATEPGGGNTYVTIP